jgi:hypothetical protein
MLIFNTAKIQKILTFAKIIENMKKLFLNLILCVFAMMLFSCESQENKAIRTMCQDIHDRYPLATLQDIYKTCYQDFFGAEHLMNDTAAARQYIHYELEQCRDTDLSLMPDFEPTGFRHRFMRVNFSNIIDNKITENQLVTIFIDAAGKDNAFSDDWLSEWGKIEETALEVNPEWADAELQSELMEAAENNYAVRHSEAFRNAYNPHYRIVRNK